MARKFDPKDIPDPPEPKPKPTPKPKGTGSPRDPSARDLFSISSENGRPIPLVYGTGRVAPNILERDNTVLAAVSTIPLWLPGHAYTVGPPADQAVSNNNIYEATQTGTSDVTKTTPGSGPNGTDDDIPDGTMRWKFVKAVDTKAIAAPNAFAWRPSVGYVVNEVVQSNGNAYACITAGTSSATGTVGYGPSGLNSDIVDGTVHWMYVKGGFRSFVSLGLCEGQIFGVNRYFSGNFNGHWQSIPHDGNQIALFLGTSTGITRPSWAPPGFTQVYSNTAVVMAQVVSGSSNELDDLSFEVQGIFVTSVTALDASPADIIIDLLTHSRRGLGTTIWPLARIDAVSTGAASAGSWRNYCQAYGLNLSWVIDAQQSVMDLLSQLLDATNSDAYMTNRTDGLGMMLKFVPRGDQAKTANGTTFTPSLPTLFNLTVDDFIGPVAINRPPASETFNSCPVEYVDRQSGYSRFLVDDPAMEDVDKRGLRRSDALAVSQVISPDAAVMLSRLRAQWSLYRGNTYTFSLGERYMLVEPSDIVTITLPVMGLTNQPVRIETVEEQSDGTYTFTAREMPASIATAATFTPQATDGYRPQTLAELNAVVVQPQQVVVASVEDANSTRGSAVHNIWPNPTSEIAPPDGADTNRPEWAGRTNIGAAAFAGSWVRAITGNGLAGSDQLGDTYDRSPLLAGTIGRLGLTVPCAPGDTFYMEAQLRIASASTANESVARIGLAFLDKNKSMTVPPLETFSVGIDDSLSTLPTAWQPQSVKGQAPAGTCYVHFFIDVQNTNGTGNGISTVQADSILAQRVINTASANAQASTALTVAAGGAAWTDIPGTSQSFSPQTRGRSIKVTLTFTAYDNVAAGVTNIRIVFGATPTQVGVSYVAFWNTLNQHQSWTFMWNVPAGTFGDVGTTTTIKAQVLTGAASFIMDANDSSSMVVEEIG